MKTCIVILGPTAVGKTAIAIEVAKQYATSIISCDSRQCFNELSIGVARPSVDELAAVPHHFIASHSIHQTVNAGVFEQYALQKVQELFAKNNVAVMVGGTGLYADAFCKGMDNIPAIDEQIRANIIANYQQHGLAWLQAQVKAADPLFYQQGEIQNPQRLMRALEVILGTNQSILYYQQHQQKERDFNIIKIGIELPRQTLIERINTRVDAMMEQGLLEEVTALQEHQQLNALQTVGYKELFAYLNGQSSLSVAVEAIKISTRQYAKRQMTWFKRDSAINWCAPQIEHVKEFLPSIN